MKKHEHFLNTPSVLIYLATTVNTHHEKHTRYLVTDRAPALIIIIK